ncbi:MAG TPA: anti-sigma factor [Chloroflexota bacterium]|nr:anti-sigma factor [Chloroflexota bacterium]
MNGTPHDPTRLSPQALEALEETLAAYALGALPPPEADAVARHLATCEACRAVSTDLRATVALLGALPAPVEPGAELKTRILTAARAEQATSGHGDRPARREPDGPAGGRLEPAAGPSADAAAAPAVFPGRASRRPQASRPRRAAWLPWLAAAAALLVALGVGLWNAQLQGELRAQSAEVALIQTAKQSWALSPTANGGSGHGILVDPAAGGPPVLLLQNIPRQPSDRTYQVWVIRDGQPASAAILPPGAAGQQVVDLQEGLNGVQSVAVSVEPVGGSPSPTGPVVLSGNL